MKAASIAAIATVFLLAGVANAADIRVVSTQEADAAKALVKFTTAPAAAAVIKRHGLEPA